MERILHWQWRCKNHSTDGATHYYAFSNDLKLLYRIRQDIAHTLSCQDSAIVEEEVERLYDLEAMDDYKETVFWTQKGQFALVS